MLKVLYLEDDLVSCPSDSFELGTNRKTILFRFATDTYALETNRKMSHSFNKQRILQFQTPSLMKIISTQS